MGLGGWPVPSALPPGTVEGELIQTPTGEKRFRLSDIIGQENGIGVENLQVGCAELGWQEGMATAVFI